MTGPPLDRDCGVSPGKPGLSGGAAVEHLGEAARWLAGRSRTGPTPGHGSVRIPDVRPPRL